jgi:transcription antitermination factor NusG
MMGQKVRLRLRRLGFDVHWPREVVRRSRRDDVLEPFFPGYMFVLPGEDGPGWSALLDVADVVTVCGVREHRRPLHPPAGFVLALIDRAGGAIDGVIQAEEDEVCERVLRRRFEAGETLRVTAGRWAQFEGVFVAQKGERVKVMMSLFGRPSLADVHAAHVEKLTAKA